MAQAGPVALEYADRHPDRLTRLMLYGSYAGAMQNATPEEVELDDAFQALIKVGWERPTPEFRRVFTTLMIPDASEEQMSWVDELQRMAGDRRHRDAGPRRSAARPTPGTCCPRLDLPTLVLHSRGDRMNNFDESRYLAAHIPGARLVALESKNHIVLEDEPAWPTLLREVTEFVAPDRAGDSRRRCRERRARRCCPRVSWTCSGSPPRARTTTGSPRRCTSRVRTVERHLQNIYAKLGLQGRSARIAAVTRLLSRV